MSEAKAFDCCNEPLLPEVTLLEASRHRQNLCLGPDLFAVGCRGRRGGGQDSYRHFYHRGNRGVA